MFKTIAGDFLNDNKVHDFKNGSFVMCVGANSFFRGLAESLFGIKSREVIQISEVEVLEIASEDNVKRIGGTVGWGAAGSILLGPAGLLAGLLLGGKKKEVTIVCKLKDGRKFLAVLDSGVHQKIQAAMFKI